MPTLDDAVLARLRGLFAGHDAFAFSFHETRRFEAPIPVLYLAPEPVAPFRRLTFDIWRLHPETPPYGGKFADVMPHLFVAQAEDLSKLDEIEAHFAPWSRGKLPIRATASQVVLMENRIGRWEQRAMFDLGAG